MNRAAVTFGELMTAIADGVMAGDLDTNLNGAVNIRSIPVIVRGSGPLESVQVADDGIVLVASRRLSSTGSTRILDWPGTETM